MSENFHDPIVPGESNHPETLNRRFSSLDTGITQNLGAVQDTLNNLIIDSGTSDAETIAARTSINYAAGSPPSTVGAAIALAAGGTYNVLAFGAEGDGSNDDTEAIQDALDAASSAGGGIVFMPKGTYKTTAGLTIDSNVTLRGVGAKSIIDWQGSAVTSAINVAASAADVNIENLTIQNLTAVGANAAVDTSDSSTRVTVRGVKVVGATSVKAISSITDGGSFITVVTSSAHGFSTGNFVWIYNTGDTDYDNGYFTITVTNSTTFTASTSNSAGTVNIGSVETIAWRAGVILEGTDSLIENCIFTTSIYSAMRIGNAGQRNRLTNNEVTSVWRGLMYDSAGGVGASHNVASHNTFDTCRHLCIKIEDDCNYNTVTNNIITNCSNDSGGSGATGTVVIEGAHCLFAGNNMKFGGSPVTHAAVDLNSAGAHSVIRDNVIVDHDRYGIQLRSACSHVDIIGNHISDGFTGIETGSGNTMIVIANNHISDMQFHGISLTGGTTRGFVITGNIIDAVGSYGIVLQGSCHNGTITGNMVRDCGRAGIRLNDSSNVNSYVAISANSIYDVDNSGASTSDETRAHIGMAGSQSHIAIVGNAADDTDTGSDSIVAAGMASCTIVGNATSDGVSAGGTYSAANNY